VRTLSGMTCPKCDGKGWIPQFQHNQKGICFLCHGTGVYHTPSRFKETYHITDDPNFKHDNSFENKQQEFGKGLYVSTSDHVLDWHRSMQDQKSGKRREYVVKLDTSKADIIPVSEIPQERELADTIIKHYGNPKKALQMIEAEKPKGDTFGIDPFYIAQQRAWAKMKGLDGISSHDPKEGEQVMLFDDKKVNYSEVMTIDQFMQRQKNGNL
jgi:hypothetical protein